MKIFVTGANGFIGRAFCRAATERGHEVLGMCRSAGVRLPGDCRTLAGSLAEIPWPDVEAFAPEVALHLAWVATPGVYLNSPENEVQAAQSSDLFRGLIERGVSHVAGTGTCIEYAASTAPLREDDSQLAPAAPYSRAKVDTCRRLQSLADAAQVDWSWFRVFYPFGEGENPERMPSWLMRKLSGGEAVELKTPDSVKDYVHIDDVAAGLLLALEKRVPGAVNIGSGEGVRILDLAREIARIVGADPALVSRANPPSLDPFPVTVADMAKLRSAGWSRRVSLVEGLQRLRASLSPLAMD
jgi:nucleoside-diphosphate-sugar epimerase